MVSSPDKDGVYVPLPKIHYFYLALFGIFNSIAHSFYYA
jgi:hypothetical protein